MVTFFHFFSRLRRFKPRLTRRILNCFDMASPPSFSQIHSTCACITTESKQASKQEGKALNKSDRSEIEDLEIYLTSGTLCMLLAFFKGQILLTLTGACKE